MNNQKGNYENWTSQHDFKDTLYFAHIPFNVVPKSAHPLAQLESLGRDRQFGKKDTGWEWERWWKEKAAFQLKISLQFKGQLWAGWPQVEGGAVPGQDWGALHLIHVKHSLTIHPLCTEVFLFGAFQFIFQIIHYLPAWRLITQQTSTGLCLLEFSSKNLYLFLIFVFLRNLIAL